MINEELLVIVFVVTCLLHGSYTFILFVWME